MPVEFNHTIVSASDPRKSAVFLAEILGLPAPTRFGPFDVIKTDNGANIDFIQDDGKIVSRHFAFRVSEAEFDAIFGRIRERALSYWADPGRTRPNEINHHDGGRGCYFLGPDGHFLEIITRPYGSGGWNP